MHKIAQSAGCAGWRRCRAHAAHAWRLRGGARGRALGSSNYSSAIARYDREQGASVAWARLLRRGRGRRGSRAACRRAAAVNLNL